MSARLGRCVAVLLAVAGGLSACLAGPAPRDHVYRLELTPPAQKRATPALPGTLEVERFTGDSLTRGRHILRSEPGTAEIAPYPYQLWSDSPPLVLQRLLADYLRAAGLAEQVVTPKVGASEDWVVGGHVAHLDQVDDSSVVVELELWLGNAERRRLEFRKTYRAERAMQGGDVEDAVRAFAVAVAEVFAAFTADAAAR